MNPKIFDTLLEPTFLVNSEKKIVYCNEPAALLVDITVRKLVRSQLAIDSVFQFNEPITALQDLAQVADASSYQEVGFQIESGKTGKVQITLQPFGDLEGQTTWLVYFRDVTLEETLQKKYRAELEQKEDVINDLQKARDELKNYSENLEKMVQERTAEVLKLNQTMRALLDSLSQGFFLFDSGGQCLSVASKACAKTLECDPIGKPVWEVLKLSPHKVPGFQKWLQTLFQELLPFPDLAVLGPNQFPHSQGAHIHLEYFPVRNDEGKISAVVGVATDISSLVQAQQEAAQERSQSKMILQLIRNKTAAQLLMREARQLLVELKQLVAKPNFDHEALFRVLHTLKGGMASFEIQSVAHFCHEAETCLSNLKFAESPEQQAKFTAKLKEACELIDPAFHLFLENNRDVLGKSGQSNERWVEIPAPRLTAFAQKHSFSGALLADFQNEFLQAPVKQYFTHFADLIQQVAATEGKQVDPLILENSDLTVNPERFENLFNTLVHAYRNAVDHGIETSEVRTAAGKAPSGKIITRFSRQNKQGSSWLVIEVIDDGGGIRPEKIRERLQSKGIPCEGESDEQVIQHVFDSQFSTKEAVTATSGRGVGMDAILGAAQLLGGSARVHSKVGQGSHLVIEVPEPLAGKANPIKAA